MRVDNRWTDPAKDAFDNAVKFLQSELSMDEYQAIWLREQTSVRDVHKAVTAAMQEYKSKAHNSKIRKWLANCSSRVMYYGGTHAVWIKLPAPSTRPGPDLF